MWTTCVSCMNIHATHWSIHYISSTGTRPDFVHSQPNQWRDNFQPMVYCNPNRCLKSIISHTSHQSLDSSGKNVTWSFLVYIFSWDVFFRRLPAKNWEPWTQIPRCWYSPQIRSLVNSPEAGAFPCFMLESFRHEMAVFRKWSYPLIIQSSIWLLDVPGSIQKPSSSCPPPIDGSPRSVSPLPDDRDSTQELPAGFSRFRLPLPARLVGQGPKGYSNGSNLVM